MNHKVPMPARHDRGPMGLSCEQLSMRPLVSTRGFSLPSRFSASNRASPSPKRRLSVFDESPSTVRVRRFNCCLSPYVLGKNEDTGSVIFTEQCTCGLSEDAFGEIVAVVDQAE